MDGGDDDLRHGGEGLRRFLGGEGDLAGQTAGEAAAFHGGALLAFPGNLSDGLLDRLRGACPDEQVVVLADILDEGLVELVPGRGQAGRRHHAAQGGDGYVRGPAADVHDHVPLGLPDVDPRAQSGGQGLLHEVDFSGPGLDAGLHHRPLRHLGAAGGDAEEQPGLEEPAGQGLAQECADHFLCHGAVGNVPLLQGPHGDQLAGGAPQHLAGGLSHL